MCTTLCVLHECVGDILADKGDRTGLAAARRMYDATILAERGELAEGRGGGGGGSDAVEVTGVGSGGGDSTLGNSAFAMATLVKRDTLVPRVYESWTDLRAARQRYFDDLTGLLDVFGSDPLGPVGGRRRTRGNGRRRRGGRGGRGGRGRKGRKVGRRGGHGRGQDRGRGRRRAEAGTEQDGGAAEEEMSRKVAAASLLNGFDPFHSLTDSGYYLAYQGMDNRGPRLLHAQLYAIAYPSLTGFVAPHALRGVALPLFHLAAPQMIPHVDPSHIEDIGEAERTGRRNLLKKAEGTKGVEGSEGSEGSEAASKLQSEPCVRVGFMSEYMKVRQIGSYQGN